VYNLGFVDDFVQNFDRLNIRDAHYTPIAEAGSSPLARPLKEYIK